MRGNRTVEVIGIKSFQENSAWLCLKGFNGMMLLLGICDYTFYCCVPVLPICAVVHLFLCKTSKNVIFIIIILP